MYCTLTWNYWQVDSYIIQWYDIFWYLVFYGRTLYGSCFRNRVKNFVDVFNAKWKLSYIKYFYINIFNTCILHNIMSRFFNHRFVFLWKLWNKSRKSFCINNIVLEVLQILFSIFQILIDSFYFYKNYFYLKICVVYPLQIY